MVQLEEEQIHFYTMHMARSGSMARVLTYVLYCHVFDGGFWVEHKGVMDPCLKISSTLSEFVFIDLP